MFSEEKRRSLKRDDIECTMPYGIQRHTTVLCMYVKNMVEKSFILIPTNIVGKCLYQKNIFIAKVACKIFCLNLNQHLCYEQSNIG